MSGDIDMGGHSIRNLPSGSYQYESMIAGYGTDNPVSEVALMCAIFDEKFVNFPMNYDIKGYTTQGSIYSVPTSCYFAQNIRLNLVKNEGKIQSITINTPNYSLGTYNINTGQQLNYTLNGSYVINLERLATNLKESQVSIISKSNSITVANIVNRGSIITFSTYPSFVMEYFNGTFAYHGYTPSFSITITDLKYKEGELISTINTN